jgi:small GTP-binding protein
MDSYYNYDYVFKFIVVGNSGVGKTSIVKKFVTNKFSRIYDTTIGVEYHMKILNINDKKIRVELWDTAGQERFLSIVKSYYRNAIGAFIVYDIANRRSFNHIKLWQKILYENNNDLRFISLIANKSDLRDTYGDRIKFSEGNQIAKKYNMYFYETSAKTGNISDIIELRCKEILDKIDSGEIPKYGTRGIRVKAESFEITSNNRYNNRCC